MSCNPIAARTPLASRILKKELDARGWTQKDLAALLGWPEQVASEIAGGRRRITPEIALALSHALGTSADLWLNLEARSRSV